MTVPRRSRILIAICCLQGLVLTVITCGDFGFYLPGSMGNWTDRINWILSYLVILIIGLAAAFIKRRYWAAAMQAGMPLLAIAGFFAYWAIPPKRYDAGQYQFLIGKSREEVFEAIGPPRGYSTTPAPSGEGIAFEYERYNDMLIRYSGDKHVAEVLHDF